MTVTPAFASLTVTSDRRDAPDRRRNSPRTLLHSLYRGRRQVFRRADEAGTDRYLDFVEPATATVAITILLLSAADALFTLLLLQRGAIELNPAMDALIALDATLFVTVKMAITAICVLFIVAHRRFRCFRLRGGDVLHGVLALYAALACYHLTLLTA